MNWIVGMLLGLILVLVMWYLTRRHETKYQEKEQLLVQKKTRSGRSEKSSWQRFKKQRRYS